jgi:hypothetical protein
MTEVRLAPSLVGDGASRISKVSFQGGLVPRPFGSLRSLRVDLEDTRKVDSHTMNVCSLGALRLTPPTRRAESGEPFGSRRLRRRSLTALSPAEGGVEGRTPPPKKDHPTIVGGGVSRTAPRARLPIRGQHRRAGRIPVPIHLVSSTFFGWPANGVGRDCRKSMLPSWLVTSA